MAKKRIFISCGQRTAEEKNLGQEIQTLINRYMDGFFAEYAHDAPTLTLPFLGSFKIAMDL